MKFDKQFAAFLYEYKYLPLQGIGEVRLDENFQLPPDADKNIFYPADGISFIYNKKEEITEELKAFLKSNISKPITLILSDLEDDILQINYWLNIGKAYTIEGVGTLTKLRNGDIEFSSGISKAEKISAIVAAVANKEGDFKNKAKNDKSKRGLIIGVAVFVVVAIVAGIVWAVISYMQGFSKNKVVENNLTTVDSLAKKQTPAPTNNLLTTNDTVRYKMYFLRTKYKEYAFEKLNSFEKSDQINMDSVIVADTLRYRLFIYKKAIPSDTVAVKKMLETYFKHDIKLESLK